MPQDDLRMEDDELDTEIKEFQLSRSKNSNRDHKVGRPSNNWFFMEHIDHDQFQDETGPVEPDEFDLYTGDGSNNWEPEPAPAPEFETDQLEAPAGSDTSSSVKCEVLDDLHYGLHKVHPDLNGGSTSALFFRKDRPAYYLKWSSRVPLRLKGKFRFRRDSTHTTQGASCIWRLASLGKQIRIRTDILAIQRCPNV